MQNCLQRVDKNLKEIQKNTFCHVQGLELAHDPEVFSPECFTSTEMFAKYLPYPEGGAFLEIGTGVGAIAILAAMRHGCSVVATDIDPKACGIAKQNILKYDLENQVDCREGNLFEPIKEKEQFDLIFWNWPFVYTPSDYKFKSPLEQAVMDPGYLTIRQFLSEVKNFLKPDGKIILTFASHAKESAFDEVLLENGFVKQEIVREKIGSNTYNLFEIKTF